ncbi:MAG: hypothetical protein ACR2N5_03690 [Solirubrobacterales bacterium]
MPAVVRLLPTTDTGAELLDELERRSGIKPMEGTQKDGSRVYWVDTDDAGIDTFDSMLDAIDPSWQEHLSR